jgi:hypothetical protein
MRYTCIIWPPRRKRHSRNRVVTFYHSLFCFTVFLPSQPTTGSALLADAVPALHMYLSAELAKHLANFSQTYFGSGGGTEPVAQLDDVKSYAPSSTDWEGAKEAASRLGWQLQERIHNMVRLTLLRLQWPHNCNLMSNVPTLRHRIFSRWSQSGTRQSLRGTRQKTIACRRTEWCKSLLTNLISPMSQY